MDDIFDSLLQAIEENAFPLFYAQREYRQEQYRVEQQLQWLEEHLSDEGRTRLEALRQAELRIAALEGEAEVRLALAAGVRLALPG